MTTEIPEVFLSNSETSYKIHALMKKRKVRKLSSKLYTSNLTDSIEKIVSRNLWEIVKLLYPNAIIADRTALELKPSKDGSIFIIANKIRPTTVGNITIKPRKSDGPISGDNQFMGALFLLSNERAILENARPTKTTQGKTPRYFTDIELEEYLDRIITKCGENAVNKIRDKMKDISSQLNLKKEFTKINAIISALLSTHSSKLKSKVGIARSLGHPFDAERVALFHKLYRDISNIAPTIRYNFQKKLDSLYFYEAYFSNFIEGTEFAIEEAKEIIFENRIPASRPEDAHDVLGTFKVVSNTTDMSIRYKNFEHFLSLLQQRHAKLMAWRKDKAPGEFKLIKNQAGSTIFVSPENVVGTLMQGYELYQKIDTAFSRAVFMMFLISEIHPFNDGNGRIGRIMMNAELIANKEQRIVIPIVFRNNYLAALRALTNSGHSEALVRTLDFAQKYTNSIDWSDFDVATDMLKKTNAFINPNVADENAIRLKLPSGII